MFLIILIAGIKHVEMTQTYLQWPPNFHPWSRGMGCLGRKLGGWGAGFLAPSGPPPSHPAPSIVPPPSSCLSYALTNFLSSLVQSSELSCPSWCIQATHVQCACARAHTHPSLQILGCPNLMPFLPLTPSPLTALSTAVGTLQGEGTWEGTDHRAVGGTCLGEGSRVGEGTRSPQRHLSLGKHKKSFDLLLPPYPL